MITEVEDIRIASTLLPLNFSARPEGTRRSAKNFSTFQPFNLSTFQLFNLSTFQLPMEAKWK